MSLISELRELSKKELEIILESIKEDSEEKLINSNLSKLFNDYKEFSGWNIKFEMISRSVKLLKGVPVLLDLASGRGNDMNRWITLKIPQVVGIEIDSSQIQEAISRYRKKKFLISINYVKGSVTDYHTVRSAIRHKKVKLITNFYSMNYYLANEKTFEEFLKAVSDSLEDNGLFIGTATDGDVLESLFSSFGPEISNKIYYAKQLISEGVKGFGKKYQFKLDTPFFQDLESGESNVIEEFIVNKSILVKYARKYNLIPVSLMPNVSPLFNLCEFPILRNNKSGAYYSRPISIASMYFGFSFIKISEKLSKQINENILVIPKNNFDEIPEITSKLYPINPILYVTNEERNNIFQKILIEDSMKGPEKENVKFISIRKNEVNMGFDELFEKIISGGEPYYQVNF